MTKSRDISSMEDWQVAKAWAVIEPVNANLLASHNVSSVTKGGAGEYTLNFETPFADKNYCVVALSDFLSGVTNTCTAVVRYQLSTASTCQILTSYGGNLVRDMSGPVRVLVFADTQ